VNESRSCFCIRGGSTSLGFLSLHLAKGYGCSGFGGGEVEDRGRFMVTYVGCCEFVHARYCLVGRWPVTYLSFTHASPSSYDRLKSQYPHTTIQHAKATSPITFSARESMFAGV
jgi:hypothetical protein